MHFTTPVAQQAAQEYLRCQRGPQAQHWRTPENLASPRQPPRRHRHLHPRRPGRAHPPERIQPRRLVTDMVSGALHHTDPARKNHDTQRPQQADTSEVDTVASTASQSSRIAVTPYSVISVRITLSSEIRPVG